MDVFLCGEKELLIRKGEVRTEIQKKRGGQEYEYLGKKTFQEVRNSSSVLGMEAGPVLQINNWRPVWLEYLTEEESVKM